MEHKLCMNTAGVGVPRKQREAGEMDRVQVIKVLACNKLVLFLETLGWRTNTVSKSGSFTCE